MKGVCSRESAFTWLFGGRLLPRDLTLLLAYLHSFNKHGLGAEIPYWGRAVSTPAGNTQYPRSLAEAPAPGQEGTR